MVAAQPRKIHPKKTLTHPRASVPSRDPTNLPLASGKNGTHAAGTAKQPPPLHRPEIQFQQQSGLSVTARDRGHMLAHHHPRAAPPNIAAAIKALRQAQAQSLHAYD